jgi:hypothetical protein
MNKYVIDLLAVLEVVEFGVGLSMADDVMGQIAFIAMYVYVVCK